MINVAVVLSGCGVYDGAEIYESVLTLMQLDKHEVNVQAFAPDIPQAHVINHLTGEPMAGESRNVLVEAARIVRGEIKALSEANADEFDAVIVPGGFGAAKNLSGFAFDGAEMSVNPEFLAFANAMHAAKKPIGVICIAPAMAAAICGDGVKCTIGCDQDTATALAAMGAEHCDRNVDEVCVDEANQLVTTPAYMLAENISQAAQGIFKLVDQVVAMAKS